jgi:apolipoprotein N-acyltransferase
MCDQPSKQERLLLFEYEMAVKQKIAYDGRAWQILIVFIALAPTALALTAQLKQPSIATPACVLLGATAFVWALIYERYRNHVEILDCRLRKIEEALNNDPFQDHNEKKKDYNEDYEEKLKGLPYMKTQLLLGHYLRKPRTIWGEPIRRVSARWFARAYVAVVVLSSVLLVAVKFARLDWFWLSLVITVALFVLVGVFETDP